MEDKKAIWSEIALLQDQIDELFENMFLGNLNSSESRMIKNSNNKDIIEGNYRKPITSMRETNKYLIEEIEMPGVTKEDINIDIDENTVQIRAEKEEVEEEEEDESYSSKKHHTAFYKKFILPKYVDPKNADAEYKNGILRIKMPKRNIEGKEKKQLKVK
ncbi:MAG: Hsp20/alpha crystallin family protein [Minisyncoccales bacterium]